MMSMEVWCNDIGKEELKYSERNLSQYHFVDHKFYMDWPRIEPGPLR